MNKRSIFNKKRLILILSLALWMLAASATLVLAQAAAEGGTITACVYKDGTLYITSTGACKRGETNLTWNILGPKGDPGLACWDLNGNGVGDPEEDINLDGAWTAADCQGPQGDQGLQGEQGLQGNIGPAGPQGAQGEQGPVGPQGIAGQDGPTGPMGPAGPVANRQLVPEANTITTLDSTMGAGVYSSITIGADGLPVFSYFHLGDGAVKVAHCSDLACSSATITTLDTTGQSIMPTAITIGADGLPIISYRNINDVLKAAHCNDAACSSFTITSLASYTEGLTSIAIGSDGLPVISFCSRDWGHPMLFVAHCNDAACSSFDTNWVDYGANAYSDVGDNSSIAIGSDGLPVVSYSDEGNGDLKVAHCNNVACSGAAITTLDSAGNVGAYSSITIGADGLPVISYAHFATNYDVDLKVAHCNDVACSSAAVTTLDSAGSVGRFTSITIGADGLPVISYLDWGSWRLKVAHCSNAFCVPYFRRR